MSHMGAQLHNLIQKDLTSTTETQERVCAWEGREGEAAAACLTKKSTTGQEGQTCTGRGKSLGNEVKDELEMVKCAVDVPVSKMSKKVEKETTQRTDVPDTALCRYSGSCHFARIAAAILALCSAAAHSTKQVAVKVSQFWHVTFGHAMLCYELEGKVCILFPGSIMPSSVK